MMPEPAGWRRDSLAGVSAKVRGMRYMYKKSRREDKGMQVTDVRIRVIDKDSKMKAVASVTFDDCFVVHDIKVIEGEKGYFIAMPSKRTPDEQFRDVAHPINPEMRAQLEEAILTRFHEAVKEAENQ